MELDVNKFFKTFIEESIELLQSMEQSLLEIDLNAIDLEKINQAFRTVHTLKSSSAAFDLTIISDFAHRIETYLEPLRSGAKSISQREIDLLLKAVDCLRQMIADVDQKKAIDKVSAFSLINEFEQTQNKDQKPKSLSHNLSDQAKFSSQPTCGWHITFNPEPTIWQQGNDIVPVLSALRELGEIVVTVNTDNLPTFKEFNFKLCYLGWEITLEATTARIEDIHEIFKWITEEKNVVISPLKSPLNQPEKDHKKSILETQEQQIIKQEKQGESQMTQGKEPLVTSIRVSTEKIDALINLVGELIITQSMLRQTGKDLNPKNIEKLQEGLVLLEQNLSELQENAVQIRMLPIATVFNRFPRVIHDLATKMAKQIQYKVRGEQTEIDRSIIEKIGDPLLHLIRNAIDHGIESREERIKMGKNPEGLVQVNAFQAGGNVFIEVEDDGAGLNFDAIKSKAIEKGLMTEKDEISTERVYEFIFESGFSTSSTVTEVSGRGVGMNVVYQCIQELGGNINIKSLYGKGSTFTMRLPLTLAIVECQVIKVMQETYLIPLISIVELLKMDTGYLTLFEGNLSVYSFRDAYIPILFLENILDLASPVQSGTEKFLVIIEVNNQLYGLACDELKSQQQVVIKSLEENYKKILGISGATILGDGNVALILDINAIVNFFNSPRDYNLTKKPATINQELSLVSEALNLDQPIELFSFYLAGEEYAIDILEVYEITMWEKATPLPNVPNHIAGVINRRGSIIPIIDLRKLLGLSAREYDEKNAIIFLDLSVGSTRKRVGVIVDAVSETYQILRNTIKSLPKNSKLVVEPHILGLVTKNDGGVIIFLSTRYFLDIESSDQRQN